MTDEQPNETDTAGKEAHTETPKGDNVESVNSPVLLEAKRLNDEKKALLDREEALQLRKEKLHAEQMVGGRAMATGETQTHEETPKEYAERVMAGKI